MAKLKRQKLEIKTENGGVSGILDSPARAVAGLTLAHGAGVGIHHRFMEELAVALATTGFAVLRFQFPYMEAGKRRPDKPAVATATVSAAVNVLKKKFPKLPLFAAGKSFGSRMSTTAAAEGLLDGIHGIICFGFPLHSPGEPNITRAKHLSDVPVRMLFLQGTRDDLADLKLMRKVCAKLPLANLHIVDGADHGFDVLKRSGRTGTQVIEELARESIEFADQD